MVEQAKISPPGQRPAGEGHRITGSQAEHHRCQKSLSSLTRDRIFGRIRSPNVISPAPAGCAARPSGGSFHFWAPTLLGQTRPFDSAYDAVSIHAVPITRPVSAAFLSTSRITGGTS